MGTSVSCHFSISALANSTCTSLTLTHIRLPSNLTHHINTRSSFQSPHHVDNTPSKSRHHRCKFRPRPPPGSVDPSLTREQASGRIGGSFARALVQAGKHTVTALTRAGSTNKQPEGVKAVEVDYDDDAALVSALEGQQFLVICLSVLSPKDLHGRLAAAAGKAGVPYVMPNAYGCPTPAEIRPGDFYSPIVHAAVNDVTSNGFSSPVTLACGTWYEWSLATGERSFGFTIADRKATFFDDGRRVVTVSTWDQCGRAFAALLSLPETSSDGSPSLADFKGKTAAINSFRVSQRDVLDSMHRVMGTTDADWEITYETTANRVRDGYEAVKRGDLEGRGKLLYGFLFDPSTEISDYGATGELANGILGLPEEDLDAATKRAVDMVLSGWVSHPELLKKSA